MQHLDTGPGVCDEPAVDSSQFVLNHTMLRIKDPERSLDFYTRILGMRLVRRLDFEEMGFTLYFLGFVPEEVAVEAPMDGPRRSQWTFSRPALLELTHNWGTESDPSVQFHHGNTEPRGYGHIGISVPDIDGLCAGLEQLGVEFTKRPKDGSMKGIAFICDPDGYRIELVEAERMGLGD